MILTEDLNIRHVTIVVLRVLSKDIMLQHIEVCSELKNIKGEYGSRSYRLSPVLPRKNEKLKSIWFDDIPTMQESVAKELSLKKVT